MDVLVGQVYRICKLMEELAAIQRGTLLPEVDLRLGQELKMPASGRQQPCRC